MLNSKMSMVDIITCTSKTVKIWCTYHLGDKMNADKEGCTVSYEF